MFCTQCGKENHSGSKFCGYCGAQIVAVAVKNKRIEEMTKDEIDIAYYQANLHMQQQALQLQQRELELARKQADQQRQQLEEQRRQYDAMMKCPRCGSTSLSGNKKGYGIGKGVVGAAMLGPIGLMAGNIGSKKVIVTCMKCGHKFKK